MRHMAATGCCNKSPRLTCAHHCRRDRMLLQRSVARIQTGLNSCDRSQRQNECKQPCRSVCTLLRQIAATKLKSTNDGASIIFPWTHETHETMKPLKMTTENVDQNKLPEQSKSEFKPEFFSCLLFPQLLKLNTHCDDLHLLKITYSC